MSKHLCDADKARLIAMKEVGLTAKQIAKTFDCTERSVQRISKEFSEDITKEEITEQEKYELDAKSRNISDIKKKFGVQSQAIMERLALGVTQEKINKANLRDIAISYGIFSDKMNIWNSISTEVIDHRHVLVGKVRVVQEDE